MDLQPEEPNVKEKDTREVLGDYLQEVTGFETAIVRTLIDLKNNPSSVLTGYLKGDKSYVSPFKILIGALSLWVLVNSFFLDWKLVVTRALEVEPEWIHLLGGATTPSAAEARVIKNAPVLIDALYTRYFVPGIILYLPLVAFIVSRRTRRFGADFKSLLAVLSYSYALSIMIFFAMSIFAYFGLLLEFFVLCVPLAILQLMGKARFTSFVHVRKYFVANGVEIERELSKVVMILTLIITIPILIWVIKA